MSTHFPVLVVGGGAAGLTTAALLRQLPNAPAVGVVEPSERHFYQPLWTLVGGGVVDKAASGRPEADYIPDGVSWVQDKVAEIDPVARIVRTEGGKALRYGQLVVAAGIQLDWHKIDGVVGQIGKGGIVSNYSEPHVEETWKAISGFQGGNAVFTFPSTPIKCAGAPQKILWLAERRPAPRRGAGRGPRSCSTSAGRRHLRGAPVREDPRAWPSEREGIETRFRHDLVAVRPQSPARRCSSTSTRASELVLKYDLLHVDPAACRAPTFVKRGPAGGRRRLGRRSTSTRCSTSSSPNVFCVLGRRRLHCRPASTAAAIRKQALRSWWRTSCRHRVEARRRPPGTTGTRAARWSPGTGG
jgi:sulfide:quinone oxidoreductase